MPQLVKDPSGQSLQAATVAKQALDPAWDVNKMTQPTQQETDLQAVARMMQLRKQQGQGRLAAARHPQAAHPQDAGLN